jgi:hypothetical protein
MINPAAILAASQDMMKFGQTHTSAMSEPFVASTPGMTIASSTNASQIIGGVQNVGLQMLQHMGNIRSSVDSQLFAHQDAQRRQKSYDFKPDMSDLRPSDAQGFPKELANEFFAPFVQKR